MKKLVCLLTVILILAVAFPAAAVDWTFKGSYKVEYSDGEKVNYKTNGITESKDCEIDPRFSVKAKFDDQLSFYYEMKSRGYYDEEGRTNTNIQDIRAVASYVKYIPTDKINIIIGRQGVFIANGFLGDDTIKGLNIGYKILPNLSLTGIIGRYDVYTDEQIYCAAAQTKFLGCKWGFTVLGSNGTAQGDHSAKTIAAIVNDNNNPYEETLIYAVDVAREIAPGYDLTAAWASNSKAHDTWKTQNDKDGNQAYRLKLECSKLKNLILSAEYCYEDVFMMWPMETNIKTASWGDIYAGKTGTRGVRFTAETSLGHNMSLELKAGTYKLIDTSYYDKTLDKTSLTWKCKF